MLDHRMITFLTLCDCRSYTKTGEMLFITQPTVTQHVQYLEKVYGAKLFHYTNKKLTLTAAGKKLRALALSMRANCEHLAEDLALAEKGENRLHFGATKTIGEFVLPYYLSQYLNEGSKRNFSMCVENTAVLLKMLLEAKLQFVILEGYFDKDAYDYELFRKEHFIAVAAKDNPLCKREVEFEELLSSRILVREQGSGTRDIAERIFHRHSFSLTSFSSVGEANNFAVLKQLVKQNLGITFVYRPVVEEELKKGTLCEISIRQFEEWHEFNIVMLKESQKSEQTEEFLKLLKQKK